MITFRASLNLIFVYFGTPDSYEDRRKNIFLLHSLFGIDISLFRFFVQYPGYLDGALSWYNPSRRPWYQLAVSNPGTNCLTAPYLVSKTNEQREVEEEEEEKRNLSLYLFLSIFGKYVSWY